MRIPTIFEKQFLNFLNDENIKLISFDILLQSVYKSSILLELLFVFIIDLTTKITPTISRTVPIPRPKLSKFIIFKLFFVVHPLLLYYL